MDIAKLGLDLNVQGAGVAIRDLNKVAEAAKNVETSFQNTTKAAQTLGRQLQQTGGPSLRASENIDRIGRRMDRLVETFVTAGGILKGFASNLSTFNKLRSFADSAQTAIQQAVALEKALGATSGTAAVLSATLKGVQLILRANWVGIAIAGLATLAGYLLTVKGNADDAGQSLAQMTAGTAVGQRLTKINRALEEQTTWTRALSEEIQNGTKLTLKAAEAKMIEIAARRASIAAGIEEKNQIALGYNRDYQDAQIRKTKASDQIKTLSELLASAVEVHGPSFDVSGLENQISALEDFVQRQDDLMNTISEETQQSVGGSETLDAIDALTEGFRQRLTDIKGLSGLGDFGGEELTLGFERYKSAVEASNRSVEEGGVALSGLTGRAAEFAEMQERLSRQALDRQVDQTFSTLSENLGGAESIDALSVDDLSGKYGLAREQASLLKDELIRLLEANDNLTRSDASLGVAQVLADGNVEAQTLAVNLADVGLRLHDILQLDMASAFAGLQQVGDFLTEPLSQAQQAIQPLLASAQEWLQVVGQKAVVAAQNAQFAEQMIAAAEEELRMQELIAKHGANSAEMAEARLNARVQETKQLLITKGFSEENAHLFSEQLGLILRQTEALKMSGVEAAKTSNLAGVMAGGLQRAAGAAMNIVRALGGTLRPLADMYSRVQVNVAKIEALKNGYSEMEANVAGFRRQKEIEYGLEKETSFILRTGIQARIALETAAHRTVLKTDEQVNSLTQSLHGAASGAGTLSDKMTDVEKHAGEAAEKISSAYDQFSDNVIGAFADWISGSESGFQGLVDSIKNAFKGLLKELIQMAVTNPIRIAMGLQPTGGGFGSQGGGSGFLNKITGGMGADGSGSLLNVLSGGAKPGSLAGGTGIMGGAGNVLSSTIGGFQSGGIMGGINGFFGGTAGGISSGLAAGGLPGITAAIGSALPIIAIGLAIGSALKRKKKGEGFGGDFDIDGLIGDGFSYTKMGGNLISGSKTTYGDLDSRTGTMLNREFLNVKDSVVDAADALGLGAVAFDDFSAHIKVNTMGLEGDEIAAKLQEELFEAFDGVTEGLFDWQSLAQEGEGATEVLMRLGNDLLTVNTTFEALGFTLYDASIAGAQAAGAFSELFGSLEEFSAATAFYFQNFYTPMEQLEHQFGQMHETLSELGMTTVPTTKAEFRSLVDSLMAAGDEAGAAQVIQMAPAYLEMERMAEQAAQQQLRAAQEAERARQEAIRSRQQAAREATASAREAINAEKRRVQEHWRSILDGLRDDLRDAEGHLRLSRDLVDTLQDAVDAIYLPDQRLQNVDLTLDRRYLEGLVGQVQTADKDRLNDALSSVTNADPNRFQSLEELNRFTGQSAGTIGRLLDEAETALTVDEQAVQLLEQQIASANANLQSELAALDAQLTRLTDINTNMIAVADAVASAENAIALLNQENIDAQSTSVSSANTNAAAILAALNAGFNTNTTGTSTSTVNSSTATGGATGGAGANTSTQTVYSAADFALRVQENDSGNFRVWVTSPLGGEFRGITPGSGTSTALGNSEITAWLSEWAQNGTQRFARGGNFGGGVRLVGEQGPELEFTGASRILSVSDTLRLVNNLQDAARIMDRFAGAKDRVDAMLRVASRNAQAIPSSRVPVPPVQPPSNTDRNSEELRLALKEIAGLRVQLEQIERHTQEVAISSQHAASELKNMGELIENEGGIPVEVHQDPTAPALRVARENPEIDQDNLRRRSQIEAAGVHMPKKELRKHMVRETLE